MTKCNRTRHDNTDDVKVNAAAVTSGAQYRQFIENYKRYVIMCISGVKHVRVKGDHFSYLL